MVEEQNREFNPNKEEVSGIAGTRPEFLGGGNGSVDAGQASGDDTRSADAAKNLKAAENAATDSSDAQSEDSLAGARENEKQAGGLYAGGDKLASQDDKTKKKGRLKKAGPIFTMFFLVFGVGGIMAVTQFFQPFAVIANFMEKYNSMHTSVMLRSERFFYAQMDSGRQKNPIKATILGPKFSITNQQAAELKRQGIEFDDKYSVGGKTTKVLKYQNGAGQQRIVTVDKATADSLRAQGKPAIDFKTVYANDANFFQRYNSGSATWRGQFANWYGNVTRSFLKRNNLSRDVFRDYKKQLDSTNGGGKKVTQDILSKRTETIEDGGIRRVNKDDIDDATSSKMSRSNIDVKSKLNAIRNKMQSGANAGCAILDTIGAISLFVTGAEALQIISITMGYFETVDKTKLGYGDDAPINIFSDAMNERTTKTYQVIDSNGELKETQPITGSAMESAGMAALFQGGKVNPEDPSVQTFNLSSSMSRLLGGVGASMTAFTACVAAKSISAAVGAVADLASVVVCVVGFTVTFGGSCGPLLMQTLVGIGVGVSLGLALNKLMDVLIPWAQSVLTRNLVAEFGGIDLGNAIASGGNIYLGNTHKANGGSLATTGEYTNFAVEQRQVLEEYKRYERESLSPFDVTSQNTFIGTILTQTMGLFTGSSLMGKITAGSSMVSSSLLALSPTAVAYEIADSLYTDDEYAEICPYLASIGAVGDAYCNPYMITDRSTIDEDAADVIDRLDSELSAGSNGNAKVNGDSDLAKYILFCDNRTSPFGIPDQGVIHEVQNWQARTGNSSLDTTIDSAIGAIPVVGDLVEIAGSKDSVDNIGYISGESCVAGNNVQAAASPNWDKAKYYQRFIEDQSVMESMGVIDKSAVAEFLEEYYEQNPLDNSYEGVLARYSGLDKETVVSMLDLMEYYDYIANYDASERYAFGSDVIETREKLIFDHENEMAGEGVLPENIVYADLRARNYAI